MSDNPATVATSTVDSSTLSLPLMAERIQHEREMRVLSGEYERQLREIGGVHERETRELVTRLEDRSREVERARIDERLEVLNGERARQENDRSTFATRSEVDISMKALGDRTTLAIRELTTAVTLLKEQRERDLGRASGTQGVQSWLAPNLGSIIAIGVGLVALYLFVSGQQ